MQTHVIWITTNQLRNRGDGARSPANRRIVHTAPPGSHAWCREFKTE